MKEPYLHDDAFLADLDMAAQAADAWHIWWLGQSGFLFVRGYDRIILDPYLSDSLTEKYARTDKPHVRMTNRVIEPERLRYIWVVLSSHSHTDHMDGITLRALRLANPTIETVAPAAEQAVVTERLGIRASVPIDAGEVAEFGPFSVTAVPAAHERVELDASGRHRYLGYVIRWGSWTVYHSGDTVLYEGIAEKLRPFNIDIALLPINGRAPERRVAGNLNGREAAWLAKEIGARLVIPCHYDMFEFNTADPDDEFVPECQRLGQPYRVLRQGERFSSSELPPRTGEK